MTSQKKPEEIARGWIDKRIEEAGWALVNRDEYHPSLNAAVIREALLTGKKGSGLLFSYKRESDRCPGSQKGKYQYQK